MYKKIISFTFKLLTPEYYVPLGVFLLLMITPFMVPDAFFLSVMILIFYYALLGEAWNILGGFGGQFSIGHVAFFVVGAYTSTLLFIDFGLSPWLGMLLAGAVAALFAWGIGVPLFRLRGPHYLLATGAIATITGTVLVNLGDVTRGGIGIYLPITEDSLVNFYFFSKVPYYYVILAMLLSAVYATYRIQKSKLGFCLLATRENLDAAESVGVNTTRVKLTAAAISGFFCGIAGTFYAQYVRFISAESIITPWFSNLLVVIAVVGGTATIMGPILGSFVLTPLSQVVSHWFSDYFGLDLLIYGVVLILVVYAQPRGIVRIVERLYRQILDRLPRKTLLK